MKAFACLEDCENTGAIIFADHAVVARRRAADELNDGEFGGLSCRRAPWADKYAGKSVPAWLMIAHGWNFECAACGGRIDEDSLYDRSLPVQGVVGTQHSLVFCCQAEADDFAERKRLQKIHDDKMIALMRSLVVKRFPSVQFVEGFGKEHVYSRTDDGIFTTVQAFVSFTFPGMKHGPASLKLNWDYRNKIGPVRPKFFCCTGDKEAFEAFAAAEKRAGTAAATTIPAQVPGQMDEGRHGQ